MCKRVLIVTGQHRIKLQREVNEEMKGLMDKERGEFGGMEVPKVTKDRVKVIE